MSGIVKSALNLFGIKTGKEVRSGGGVSLEDFLEKLPAHLGYDIEFRQENKDDVLAHFEIKGDEAEEFLTKNSNMLEALSHISMRILRRQAGVANAALEDDADVKKFRVTFDSDGYREKKIENLKEMAATARQKVIDAGGKPSYLPALSPSERKVIHTHLAELGEVTSESIGKGTFKRVRVKLNADSPHRKARAEGPRSERSGGGGGRRNDHRGGERTQQRGGRRDGGRRNNRDQRPSFPSDVQPNHARGGFSFVNDPFGVGSDNRPEVNGNVAVPEPKEQIVDDNIGNRLAPGEDRFDPHND